MHNLSGEELGRMLEDFVNSASKSEMNVFVAQITRRTHRTLQQKVMGLVVGLLESWAKDGRADRFDARNEATVKLAAQMTDATPARCLPYI